jgi:hypothetical protein
MDIDSKNGLSKHSLETYSGSKFNKNLNGTDVEKINHSSNEELPIIINEKPSCLDEIRMISALKLKLRTKSSKRTQERSSCRTWLTNYDSILRIYRNKGQNEISKVRYV